LEDPPTGWLGAILLRRSGTHPNAIRVAGVSAAIWHDIAAALQPIIGKQGFAALYNRSAALTSRFYPWLANSRSGEDHTVDFDALQSVIAQQSDENAAQGSGELLQTFYVVLTSLIGSALSEQLLAPVHEMQTYER
jgi:hypothetical protein